MAELLPFQCLPPNNLHVVFLTTLESTVKFAMFDAQSSASVERTITMEFINALSFSSDSVQWVALTLATGACGLVALALVYTRQYRQPNTVDVERQYIADDEITWTELMRILD